MPEPMSAQSNRFYTKEFFAQCSKALKQRGVIAFKIRSSENLWTKLLTERNKGIYYALKSAFENTIVLPGAFNIFIASKSKLTTDTKFLINRFLERELETKLVSPQYINYIFTNTRFAEIQRILLEGTQNVNSDLQPVCYGYTISIWLSKFFPELANYNKPLYKILDFNKLLIIAAIIIVGLTIAGRKSFQAGRLVLVFGTAFIGMIAETLLIILYQTKNGVLYRDIGILLMMFMLGLTLGAVIIHRLFILQKLKRFKLAGIILILLFTFMNLVIYFVTKTDMLGGLLSISALLMLNGIIVSGIFAYTSFNKVINQLEIVKPLYSADLIGGSLGSIIASLIFIPVLGLLSTSLFLIAMTFSLIFLII
jgi:spermidine synthase